MTVIKDLMSKLKAAVFLVTLSQRSRLSTRSRSSQKMKSAGDKLKRVENWICNFQNFYINLTFFVDFCLGHFVVVDNCCRGAMYAYESTYLLSQTWQNKYELSSFFFMRESSNISQWMWNFLYFSFIVGI